MNAALQLEADPAESTRLQSLFDALCTALPEPLSIAFSGGVDSRFLAHIAALAGKKPLLLTARGAHCAPSEHASAVAWAAEHGFELRIIDYDPLQLPPVALGQTDRCYHCKKGLFTLLLREARGVLCDGTHASDCAGYRPGLRALEELGIFSPLAYCGLEKKDIRLLARASGLEKPDQKARPCLLTRLPYHRAPDGALLQQIARHEAEIEQILSSLLPHHAQTALDFRLRLVPRVTSAMSDVDDAKHSLEIHLSSLPPNFPLETFQNAVHHIAPVRVLETLSGFFDRL